MTEFIRVLGDDPVYTGRKTYMWLDRRFVRKVYPMYAVEKDGQLWRSTPDHDGAKAVSYRLVDLDGVEYSCGNLKELQKLGIEIGPGKPNIGFIGENGDDPTPVDMG